MISKKEIDNLVKNIISKNVIKKQVLVFDLPSEYLGSKTKTQIKKDTIQEIRTLGSNLDVSAIRTARKKFYSVLHKTSYKTLLGWVIREGANLDELSRIISELNTVVANNHTSRRLQLVEVWLPTDFLIQEIQKDIEKLGMDYRNIREKIKEAKNKATLVRKLQYQLSSLEEEITNLENEMRFLKQ
jgi:hypothetical protein